MIGLAGKLPAHGDFVRRGGPAAVLAALDRWLDVELGRAPDLLARIDALAEWRFAVRLEEHDVLGVMMASGDAVGRRFPILATLAIANGATVARPAAASWGDAVVLALAGSRDGAGRADEAIAALEAVARPATGGAETAAGWWRADGRHLLAEPRLPAGDDFARLFGEATA